jgi:SCP-2 sterol transfer family
VVGLGVSFRREEFADLTETYELVIDGQPFTVEVSDGVVDTRPGGASSPSISLGTDADTFVALMTGRASAAKSLANRKATLEGERSVLERFVDASLTPRRSRLPSNAPLLGDVGSRWSFARIATAAPLKSHLVQPHGGGDRVGARSCVPRCSRPAGRFE